MANDAVLVEGLGKRYVLGQREPYKTLRGSISRLPRRLLRRPSTTYRRPSVWALRDVSFSLKDGEVLGIIGHNGAGKSTLLKMLSRVTTPTAGRALLYGRASALLEVGTGFHPELTGRENVFVNGSVLGMRQSEIARKFDAIVEFSETGAFIDTPIKRYSSGMQVRLAFAVAAFLEPEILIIDEVLAVGDVAFQRKCLGKLGNSAREGRTVLFVSHNLPAIRTLCSRAIVLNGGQLVFDGEPRAAIDEYLSTKREDRGSLDLLQAERPHLDMGQRVRFRRASLLGREEGATIGVGERLSIRVDFDVLRPISDAVIVLNVLTLEDVLVAQSVTTNCYRPIETLEPGAYSITATVESAMLQPGQYTLGFGARSALGVEDQIASAGLVEFVETVSMEFPWFGGPGGYLRLPVDWSRPELVSTSDVPGVTASTDG